MLVDHLYVDAHVHFHSVFSLARFLDATSDNFRRYFHQGRADQSWIGLLLLADTPSQNTMALLADSPKVNGWTFQPSDDDCAWLAFHQGVLRLALVGGQQVETAERLEVLALATNETIPQRQPIAQALEQTCHIGAIPVLPWGFGKWTFRRGQIVADLMHTYSATMRTSQSEVFLGDNGSRTGGLVSPKLFRTATTLGMRILPGSDPLPFASHQTRAGSYGFALSGPFDPSRPASQLRHQLAELDHQPPIQGRLANPWRFCLNQLAMQVYKRR